ncbi:hypothetical protein OGAPHI_003705 [Ogataea philodendri]|uniref:Interferon-related developmental regulator N-terminal domain-containing protein n=1 Tax=Ogataea philodendri TaxID=1378263 RepID=A0A9P8P6F3_9ASCO|nr:uncharacterized protein OGAPHI_003705 [Ogataea philodendri]KAH3665519.1 hypothetical protein OGAPHI_003705 [Ogataea philodendri]
MSQLQREMRTPLKQFARSESRASSGSGIRSPSMKSPKTDTDPDEFDQDVMDMSFMRLDDLLRAKLQDNDSLPSPSTITGISMSRQESRANSMIGSIIDGEDESSAANAEPGEEGGVIKIYKISDVIAALAKSRSKINSSSREFLLGELYRMIVKKPLSTSGAVVNETDLELLVSFVKGARSQLEFVFALRAAVAYIASDVDEVATTAIEQLFPVLLNKIYSPDETYEGVRSSCLIAYASLLLVIYDESQCYGLGDSVETLMELADGYSAGGLSENDEDVVVNTLNAIAIIISLIYKANRDVNTLVQENIPQVMTFLSSEFSKKVQKAAAIVVALMYEVFDFGDEDDPDEPYDDFEDLKSIINQLVRYSSKKVSKKDKKESRSIFREVLHSLERAEPEEGEEKEILSRFKLNKSKALPITSWFEYVRLVHLKYIFGSELNLHYVASKEVRNLLAKPDDESSKFNVDVEEPHREDKAWKTESGRVNDVKRDQKIREARELKVREKFGDLSLE